jgi:hypothetical protein
MRGTMARYPGLLASARAAKGFMPDDEGLALARVAGLVESGPGTDSAAGPGIIVEVGAYCGRSTLYLAAGLCLAAEEAGRRPPRTVVFSLDHHHGSEENQAGWEHHDRSLIDPRTGRIDTLPLWRATIGDAGAEDLVVALVGDSAMVAERWGSPADLVFIDGGHGSEPAWADYRGWAPKVGGGGLLAIHDVFPDPADGGRPPYELYCRALESGAFEEVPELGRGSLRVLRRVGPGC